MKNRTNVSSSLGLPTAVLMLVCAGLSSAEDRRPDPSRLRIMTINGLFLWDGVAPEEGDVDFPWKNSQTEAEEHMEEVARLIRSNDPDIVNVVEVENGAALNRMNDLFLAGRSYKVFFVQGKDSATGQDVALLTRVDPEGGAVARDERLGQSGTVQKGVSKHYFGTIPVGDTRIFILGLHFLARPLDDTRRLEREAQADAVRSMILAHRCATCEIVVLGDFNDFDGGADSSDHKDSMPITNVLRIVRGLGPTTPADDLLNAAKFVPKGERFTAFFDQNENNHTDPPQEFTSIDHVLLSQRLADRVQVVEIDHDFDPVSVTDHFPVVVQVATSGATPVPTAGVRIVSLLPNPSGNENDNEAATLANQGTVVVDMTGWTLRDRSGSEWRLDSMISLEVGQQKTIQRNGQPMAMSNRGDTIELRDRTGRVLQTVNYPRVAEGELVTPAP